MKIRTKAITVLSFLLVPGLAMAQINSNVSLLTEAHNILYQQRVSYNLNPSLIKASLIKANAKIDRIKGIKTLLKQQEVLVDKYNAEDFFLNYILKEIEPTKDIDSIKFYLKFAFLSAAKAKDAYIERTDGQVKKSLNQMGIDLASIELFSNEMRKELPKYNLQHLEKVLAYDDSFPAFPWPPPKPSAIDYIPSDFLVRKKSNTYLSDIDKQINEALESGGYYERSYFSVPNGFALVTRLEQINPDASSVKSPDRWSAESGPLNEFSLWAYLRALFTAGPAYYRIIAFVVTDQPFSHTESDLDPFIISSGANKLPSEIGQLEFTGDYDCTALIYEFKRSHAKDEQVKLTLPSKHVGRVHLEKSKLWKFLKN